MYNGKLTRLRRLEPGDASIIFSLWNSYELRQYLPTPLPMSYEALIQFIESTNGAFTQRKEFTFGIEALEMNKLMGIINLTRVSWISRHAEVGLFAIFDPGYWGHGYGSDAMTV
jgi:RimJ/RimL family protein N-acetyltransferase